MPITQGPVKVSDKPIVTGGKTVTVSGTIETTASGVSRFKATATVGQTVCQSVLTFHPNKDISLVQLQKDLDSFRQRLADEAAAKENVRGLLAQLK